VSKDHDIDLEEVQSYELATVPLALANMDGSLRKLTKGLLEMGSLARSTLPAYSLHQTAYIVTDCLTVIQMLSKGKMQSESYLTQLQQLLLRYDTMRYDTIRQYDTILYLTWD